MNSKRWIALVAAAGLLGVSIVINAASAVFTSDFSTDFDEFLLPSTPSYSEYVLEEGNMDERIAVLRVDGVIQDTDSTGSFFGAAGYDHQFFLSQLEQVKEDETVKAILLSVDSPGGGVVESAEIYDAIVEIQEETDKPVYASMGSMAASGGYYISAPADKIYANRETLTGSIGVIMESVNYSELAERYGVDFVTIKTGEYKDIMSPTREMTEDEREMLQDMLNDSYESFVDVIEEGRGMSEAAVKEIADGRIMNGRQAVEANLIDELGFEEDALEGLKTDFDLQGAEVFEYGYEEGIGSILSMKVQSLFGNGLETQALTHLLTEYSSPRTMYLYGGR